MGKDSFSFPLASFRCHLGTVLSYCELPEKSVGSALMIQLIWTSLCLAKNPCVTTISNFYHWHGCCFSPAKLEFPSFFFQIYSYSALKDAYFSTFLPIQAKKERSTWDFLDCSFLETIHEHKWVVSTEKKAEELVLNGMRIKLPNPEMWSGPNCSCIGFSFIW